MNLRILIFTLGFCFLFACNLGNRSRFLIEVKNVSLVYTKPDVFLDRDTTANFQSYIFFQVECLIKNFTGKKEIIFNNLIIKDYSFDFKMKFMNGNILFYNYPFSNNFYPVRNKQVVNALDSVSISLQTPVVFSIKDAGRKKIDSLFRILKESKFYVELNRMRNADVIIDTSSVKFNFMSISNKCFLPSVN